MEKSLTEGNSLKQILCFAFPLLLGNLFQQLYNLADSIIVGKTLGIDALASVGASGSLNFLILGFCIGLCSGFAIPVAQTFVGRFRFFNTVYLWLYFGRFFP